MGDTAWQAGKAYREIIYETCDGIAKITINRPQVRNAFTPTTVAQMSEALVICRQRNDIRVVVLTGAGDKAFCSGSDRICFCTSSTLSRGTPVGSM